MILVGSRATEIRAPQLLQRAPLDTDFLCSEEDYFKFCEKMGISEEFVQTVGNSRVVKVGNSIFEFSICAPGDSTEQIIEWVEKDQNSISASFGKIPTLDVLFLLKSSHRFRKDSPHFWKTAADYHKMKIAGAKIPDELLHVHKLREKETYTNKHPSLMKKKEDFFSSDGVKYVYDHDSIHMAVKLYDRPAYTYFAKDGHEVMSDKEKFFAAPYEIKLASVIEETTVLAIERSLVPHPGVLTHHAAWMMSLSKVCSSITSGWWREWAYQNIFSAAKNYPANYHEKFQIGLANGVVKPYSTSKTSDAE
jgi:hypothetical protein